MILLKQLFPVLLAMLSLLILEIESNECSENILKFDADGSFKRLNVEFIEDLDSVFSIDTDNNLKMNISQLQLSTDKQNYDNKPVYAIDDSSHGNCRNYTNILPIRTTVISNACLIILDAEECKLLNKDIQLC